MTAPEAKTIVARWAYCTCCPPDQFWPGDRGADRCRPPLPACECVIPPTPRGRWRLTDVDNRSPNRE